MKFTKDRRTPLQKEVDRVTGSLGDVDFDTDEYSKRLDTVERLSKLHGEVKPRERINPNTIINVAGSLIGIAAILTYETVMNGVITSKALGFVLRSRV